MNRQIKSGVYRAFTLVELLVVMAITSILLGLIFGPLVQTMNLTNRARVQVLTQDTIRRVAEQGQIDLAQSVFVFDNSNQPINFWVHTPDGVGNPLGAPVPQPIPFAMVDLVPPAHVNDQLASLTASQIDPTNGLPIDRGPVQNPMVQGRTIVRYFVGLRNNASKPDSVYGTSGRPIKPYENFYDFTAIYSQVNHNPFILYRAEVSPFTAGGAADTRLFKLDPAGNPILNDPNFFYDVTTAVQPADPAIVSSAIDGWKDDNGDGSVNICENWKVVAKPVVPKDRADEVVVEKDENKLPVFFADPVTARTYMKISPLVKFQPTYLGNDAGAPTNTNDLTYGAPNTPPTAHRESYGHWTSPFNLYVYRGSLAGPILNYYYYDGGTGSVLQKTYDTSAGMQTSSVSANFYPLRFDPDKPSTAVILDPANPPSLMFYVDKKKGMVNFALPDYIWPGLRDAQGRPTEDTASIFTPSAVKTAYENYVGTNPAQSLNAQPYIDLRYPEGLANSPVLKIPNLMIVPGSDVVNGPDMRPGPNYGHKVAYTANNDPTKLLGENEYRINYTNIPNADTTQLDPMLRDPQLMGVLTFRKQAAVSNASDPHVFPTMDNNGQPPYQIHVRYKMQNNFLTDTVKADYLTRQLMSFTLGVRLYEFNSGQPQQVSVTQKVTMGNLLR